MLAKQMGGSSAWNGSLATHSGRSKVKVEDVEGQWLLSGGGTVGSLTKKCARPIFNNYSKKIFFQKNVITHVISKDIAQNSQISNFCL